ncbi:hypothetical protein M8J76_007382 [Diaphorina citri]|nr:hypothetical protein M8J76_007382 [Diaphorina citri]
MKTVALTIFSILIFSPQYLCEEETEATKFVDNETVQSFIKQLVGLFNQGTSDLVGNGLNGYQDVDGYQRPLPDFSAQDYSGLDSSRPPFFNRPYRPNYGRPGAPGRPGIFSGSDQQGQLGNLLGLLGQGGLGQGVLGQGGLGQYGQFGPQSSFGPQSTFGGAGAFEQNGIDPLVPYPYPARPPTRRPYPGSTYQQQSLFGALYSIAQYDDLRCVPRLLCEITAGSNPGSNTYYPSYYGQNQQPSILPFLSKDSLLTILTVLNFVDESPILVFGRAALLGYTARGDSRQCLTAYPLCPRNPDQLVDYLNNHNGGFFRFFNQQLPHIPQYAPFYQNNYQSNLQGSFGNQQNGFYNKQPYRKFKKFTKLYDTENSKKLPSQYADKNQNYEYYKEPRILYGKETNNKVTFDTLPPYDFSSGSEGNFHSVASTDISPHRGGKKLKFQELEGPEVSHTNTNHMFFPSESQNSHTFIFPSEEYGGQFQQSFNYRRPKAMTFPDKTGTGTLILDVDKYGNYVVRKDREEPLLESVNKVRFVNENEPDYYNKHSKRQIKKVVFP